MSRYIKCDKCGEEFRLNERKTFQIDIVASNQIAIDLCKKCIGNFFIEYLDFVYSSNEGCYIPKKKKKGAEE